MSFNVRRVLEGDLSNYANLVSDFPKRCLKLFRASEKRARFDELEVTLMLSIATTSIIIPFERLRGPESGPGGDRPGHPIRDWSRYKTAQESLQDALEHPFVGSVIWPQSSPGSWCCGGPVVDVSRDLDSWNELHVSKPISNQKKALTVLKHLRNALAHGNIFTRGSSEIESLVLLSEVGKTFTFNFITVSPADFEALLRSWLSFLSNLPMPTFVIPEGPLWENAFPSGVTTQGTVD